VSRRTTLRPFAEDVPTPPAPPTPALQSVATTRGMPPGALLGGVAALIGAVIIGSLLGAGRLGVAPTPTPAPVEAAAPTVVVVAGAPDPVVGCPSLVSFLDVIGSYERQARWELAASSAQTALRTPGLCDADRAALGQKLITLNREALFEQPPSPEDIPGQRRVATAYADLKTSARQYGVAPPAPLPIAQSAYDKRLFLLATVAFADAFANGDSSAQDRDIVRADYAAQYNLGLIWSQRTDLAQHQEGMVRLATACRISQQNQLGSPEACNRLQSELGAPTNWPAPLRDPLINPHAEREARGRRDRGTADRRLSRTGTRPGSDAGRRGHSGGRVG
jgi:hypothetical protein